MNQICQLRYLIIKENVGLLCILLVKMMILYPPTSFLWERYKEVSEANWLLRKNVAKQKRRAQLAPGQDQGLAGCLMSPSAVEFLIQSETFNKVPKKAASLVCQHCEACLEEEKESLSCVNLILFSSFVLLLPLPLLFLSVLQDPLLSNLWTPYEHVTSRATAKWR